MKLTDLAPEILEEEKDGKPLGKSLWLSCPECFRQTGKLEGCHSIRIPYVKAGEIDPRSPPGWQSENAGDFEHATVNPSVRVIGGCAAHFFVRDGEIVFA